VEIEMGRDAAANAAESADRPLHRGRLAAGRVLTVARRSEVGPLLASWEKAESLWCSLSNWVDLILARSVDREEGRGGLKWNRSLIV